MKAKVYRGDGFRGLLDYCFLSKSGDGPPLRGTIVGGNMLGTDPRSLAAEFGISRCRRPDIRRPVWHCSLTCPKGEVLTEDKWEEIAADYMQMMGFDPSMQYVAVRHQDTDYDHIHIIASRVGLNGKIFKGQWEAKEAIKATQLLEKRYDLTITKGDDEPTQKKRPKQGEIEKALRTGQRPPKIVLQDTIDQILATGPTTAPDFVSLLQAHGITARPNIAATGKFSGFSFSLNGDVNKAGQPIAYKGSSLGKSYTVAGLESRGLQYNPIRDMPILTGRQPEPAPDYSGEPKIRRKNGGREFSLIFFMRYEPSPGGQLYRWQSGAPAFIDQGNEITCAGKAAGAKVKGMLDLAREKGWSRIELTGPREFQLAAAMEAARRGISISGDNREIQEIWRQEHERTAAERTKKPQPRSNQLDTNGPSASPRCGLRGLHELNLVPLGTGSELLLQGDARDSMGINEQNARDSELRREDVINGIETRAGSATATTTEATDTAGNRTSTTRDPGAAPRNSGNQDSCRDFREPDPTYGRSEGTGDHPIPAAGAIGHKESPTGRDPENRPRRIGGGLAALKETIRQPASPDRNNYAATEERTLQIESSEEKVVKFPAPGV